MGDEETTAKGTAAADDPAGREPAEVMAGDAEPADEEEDEQRGEGEEEEEEEEDRLSEVHSALLRLFKRLGPQRQSLAPLAREKPEAVLAHLARIVPGTIVAGLQEVIRQVSRLTEELAERDLDHEDRLRLIEASPLMLAQQQALEDPAQLDDLFTDLLRLIDVGLGRAEMTDELVGRLPQMREQVEGMQHGLYAVLGPRDDLDEEAEEETADGTSDGTEVGTQEAPARPQENAVPAAD